MQAHSPLDSAVISEGTEAKADGDDGKSVDETGHTVIMHGCYYGMCVCAVVQSFSTQCIMFIVTKLFLTFYPL